MAIIPDDKDWTWVLERACPDCGFDSSAHERVAVVAMLRAQPGAWQAVLAAPGVAVRPASGAWSPLEYACHVRDVFVLFDERLHLMLDHDNPLFANWDQDATAIDARYGDQDPVVVGAELAAAAEQLAHSFEGVDGATWSRRGRRSDGASFDIESFSRYMLHDPIHHLYDVGAPR